MAKAKARSAAQRAATYARNVWGFESATWNGNETRRLLASAFLAGMRAQKRRSAGSGA